MTLKILVCVRRRLARDLETRPGAFLVAIKKAAALASALVAFSPRTAALLGGPSLDRAGNRITPVSFDPFYSSAVPVRTDGPKPNGINRLYKS
jgi:hypothetical protein